MTARFDVAFAHRVYADMRDNEGRDILFVPKDDYDALDAERQRLENELACGGVTCHANQYLKERDAALATFAALLWEKQTI